MNEETIMDKPLWSLADIALWWQTKEKSARHFIEYTGLPQAEPGKWVAKDVIAWVMERHRQGIVEMCPTPTALYRHFAKDGALLYVGISLTPILRLKSHRKDSPWFREICRIEMEWFPSWTEAEEAERLAIQNEGPRCNKAHVKR